MFRCVNWLRRLNLAQVGLFLIGIVLFYGIVRLREEQVSLNGQVGTRLMGLAESLYVIKPKADPNILRNFSSISLPHGQAITKESGKANSQPVPLEEINISQPPDNELPDKDSQTPDRDSQTPDKDSRTPDKDSRRPDKDSRRPDKDSRRPDKDSRRPDKDSQTPDKDSRRPNKDSQTPDKDSRRPDKDSRRPDKDSQTPDKDSQTSDKDSQRPDKDSPTPDKDSQTPDKDSQAPKVNVQDNHQLGKDNAVPPPKPKIDRFSAQPIDSLLAMPLIKGTEHFDIFVRQKYLRCRTMIKRNTDVAYGKCRNFTNMHFINGSRVVAMPSFPGSGSTWARTALEQATGIYTGSVYCDRGLKSKGFAGEWVVSANVLTIKTHFPSRKLFPEAKEFRDPNKYKDITAVILLVRNPLESFISKWNFLQTRGSHVAITAPDHFGMYHCDQQL